MEEAGFRASGDGKTEASFFYKEMEGIKRAVIEEKPNGKKRAFSCKEP